MKQTQVDTNARRARSSPRSERPGKEGPALAGAAAAVRAGAAAAMPNSHFGAVVRRARATDLEGFDAFLAGLSVETSTRRFFTPTTKLCRRQARLLLDNDGTRGAWLAVKGRTVVAHGCWVALSPGTAEVAMVVADECQRHGIGRRLMRELLRDMGEVGMDRMEMVVQPDNRGTVDLITRSWPQAKARSEDGLLTFVTPLKAESSAAA
jgi:GNAT superfamily N-acetyltransferase